MSTLQLIGGLTAALTMGAVLGFVASSILVIGRDEDGEE